MKHLSAILFSIAAFGAQAQSITSQDNFTWSPDLLMVTAGTDITITVTGNHFMREVSEATWNANGNTGNGGFEFGLGTHNLNITVPGTYYYVCVPHVGSFGMKGRIIVETNTGVVEHTTTTFSVLPNPASDRITVTAPTVGMRLSLIDAEGREVLQRALVGETSISIGHLAAGNYSALLIDSRGTITERQRIAIAH